MEKGVIGEKVRKMLEHEGIYIVAHIGSPEEMIIVASIGGCLVAYSRDQELAPDRFNPGMFIKHGPLT